MIRPNTRWEIADLGMDDRVRAEELAAKLKLPPIVARLLVQRGYADLESARKFLFGGVERLHDPFLLKGMKEAAARIRDAAERGERVRIYGDYDADGVSSTALMIRLFGRLGLRFDYYIPHRTLEGYGLNEAAIAKAAEAGVTLIVTVDTGISAVEQIAYARSLGIDVIVTDHHEPPQRLPEALALINPKQDDCPYPFKGLAGVGVAFKLAEALLGEPPVEWTDIVALGTIADLMPLQGENRILVRLGLQRLQEGGEPGLAALADVAGIDLASIQATNIAFGMAPRINAAGRLEHADEAVRLLTAADSESAAAAAFTLDNLNRERQRVVDEIVREALAMWADRCSRAEAEDRPEPSVIVLAGVGWNAGVVGIVASKLIERFYKPTLVLGIDAETGMCKGSARSVEGFDLHAALTRCAELLDHFGGHQAAAGMSLHRSRLGELEESLFRLADEWLTADDRVPKTRIDLACGVEEATLDVLTELQRLEPFGAGNPAPKLLLRGGTVADRRTMGKEGKHLKLSISGGGRLLDAVGFGCGELAPRLTEGAHIELVGELAVNEWNGRRRAQFMVSDMCVPHVQLIDCRLEALTEPVPALAKLADRYAVASCTALVPSPAWKEVLEAAGPSKLPHLSAVYTYDDIGHLSEGQICPELILLGTPPSAAKLAEALRAFRDIGAVYALYGTTARSGRAVDVPDREQFGRLYTTLRRVSPLTGEDAAGRLATMLGWQAERVRFMLNVFAELEFVSLANGTLMLADAPEKKDLSRSALYREAGHRRESDLILFAETKAFAEWIRSQSEGAPQSTIQEGADIS
ncbi:single-stranded-DNA-specific exonuclease RecJ [Paenibacillus humicola]|uniref:single-stranded-DNA-specific exonuclease RecJ n=1 Tax=Paenibacillus humicola TaxID=3110540 RepID=UPI00237A63E4|nr:single-stranded-DNA-specific exonuclease RecJ [Paenibacillus humicola]